MFTGIVEEVGAVAAVREGGLRIAAPLVCADLRIGDSVSVNGVCLTAVAVEGDAFEVDTVPETLRRSNLGELRPESQVNLERALRADGRFGGHIVQGHVEGVGTIDLVEPDGEATVVRVRASADLARYIVKKGFVAVDGTSLTVVDRGPDWFTFTLIPFSAAHTVLGSKHRGDRVNLETDVLAKYVERLFGRDDVPPTAADQRR